MLTLGAARASRNCLAGVSSRRINIGQSFGAHIPACLERRDEPDEGRFRSPIAVHPARNNKYNNRLIVREYHASHASERGAAIALGLGALAATAKAGQYAVQGYNEWQKQREIQLKEEEEHRQKMEADGTTADQQSEGASQDGKEEDATLGGKAGGESAKQKPKEDGKRENIFAAFFNLSVGSKYYEGGFEDKMTRKEAALILGVRESSAAKRIKEAHRKLLILNHPDTGGSTYMAGKINEAKELLLKGKKG